MKVTIVGGAGAMGKWFVRQLTMGQLTVLNAKEIVIADTNKDEGLRVADAYKVSWTDNNIEATRQADIVIVSVPIETVTKVIEQVAPFMKTGSLLMDITSVKFGACKAMLKNAEPTVELVSCHPMFAPDAKNFEGQIVILIQLRSTLWFPKLRELLRNAGAKVVVTSAEDHDRMMAVVQGITHFSLIVSAATMKESSVSIHETENYASTLWKAFFPLMFRVVYSNPGLYAHIQAYNPHVQDAQRKFIEMALEFHEMTKKGDIRQMIEYIQSAGMNIASSESTIDRYQRMSNTIISSLSKEIRAGESLLEKKVCLRDTKTMKVHVGILRKLSSDTATIEETRHRITSLNLFKYEFLDYSSTLEQRRKIFGESSKDFSAFFHRSLDPELLVEIVKMLVPNITKVETIEYDVYKGHDSLERVSICLRVHYPRDEPRTAIEKNVKSVLTRLGGVLR